MKVLLLLVAMTITACGETPPATTVEEAIAEETAEEETTEGETVAEPVEEVTSTATETVTSETSTATKAKKKTTSTPVVVTTTTTAAKLTSSTCTDPDLAKVASDVTFMLCNGTMATGTLDLTNLVAGNVKTGVTIGSVTGTYSGAAAVADCTTNGATGCKTTATYKSADLTNLTAANVKSGVTIAGTAGSLTAESHVACTANGQTGCVTTSTYKSADLSNLSAGNVKTGITIAGITGTVPVYSNCSANSQTGCIATSTYKSADLTNLTAANIKSGTAIAGVTGQYPSATYPLTGATAANDLTAATLNIRIKSAASFEWFDSAGARQTGAGDADITAASIKNGVSVFGTTGTYTGTAPDAANIRAGVTVSGVTGTLKTQCRNGATLATFDAASTPDNSTTGGTANSTVNHWDSLAGNNQSGVFNPTELPSDWSATTNTCNASDWVSNIAGATCVNAGSLCVYQDKISGMYWTNLQRSTQNSTFNKDWAAAVTACEGLTMGGFSDWRLPTQKELMQAYVNGIATIESSAFVGDMNQYFWTSTSLNVIVSSKRNGWAVIPETGATAYREKTNSYRTMCVR